MNELSRLENMLLVHLTVGDIAVFKHLLKGCSLVPAEERWLVLSTNLLARLESMTDLDLESSGATAAVEQVLQERL